MGSGDVYGPFRVEVGDRKSDSMGRVTGEVKYGQ